MKARKTSKKPDTQIYLSKIRCVTKRLSNRAAVWEPTIADLLRALLVMQTMFAGLTCL